MEEYIESSNLEDTSEIPILLELKMINLTFFFFLSDFYFIFYFLFYFLNLGLGVKCDVTNCHIFLVTYYMTLSQLQGIS